MQERAAGIPVLAAMIAVSVAACGDAPAPQASTPPEPASAVYFDGARVLTGDGGVIENATFSVDNGRFAVVAPAGEVDVPDGATLVDLRGKTVMPAIVDSHVHLSMTREALTDDLQRRAWFGVGAALSMGSDVEGSPLEMRREDIPDAARFRSAGTGITRPEPGRSEVHWIDTAEAAREAVRTEVARGVDVIKIWVDDRDGQFEKLTPELYGAIIDEAHAYDRRVAAHIFDLEDAKGLLAAGVDLFAHSVRDQDIDDEFVELAQEHPKVVLIPNLPWRGFPTAMDWAAGVVDDETRASIEGRAPSDEAQASFGIQGRNLARLNRSGMIIAMGTDGNSAFAPHIEMEDMVAAGMSPSDVIVAATRNGAAVLELADTGTIAPGMVADFLVLDANPLDDITNSRRINAVYLGGDPVDRDGLAAEWRARAGD